MDDKKKRALIKELAIAKNFEPSYSEPNRRWFVEKLIRGYEAGGLSNQQVETKTRSMVAQSKGIVESKRDFQLKLKLHQNYPGTEKWSRPRRVELLYGLIATDPRFAETPNEAFFDFIAARRYRAVQRMILFVNLDQYFVYPPNDPGECPGKPFFHVNVAAEPFWEPMTASGAIPLKLKPQPPAGTVKPLEAITNLWKSQADPCEKNTFECATAMSCVLMDSLLEATDPSALLSAVTGRGPTHLRIGHPHKDEGAQFLWDESTTRLFSKETALEEDLLVGDHVYVWNHPIYADLDPNGVWRGEHSLLADSSNRNLKNGLRFSGHGFEAATIAQINDEFLMTVNTLLNRAYRLGSIFLEYMRSGRTSIPASKVTGPDRVQFTVPTNDGPHTADVDLYHFDIDYEIRDYRFVPTGAVPIPKKKLHGFIVSHVPGGLPLLGDPVRPTFGLHWDPDLARVKLRNPLGGQPFFQRTAAPPPDGSEFDPLLWQVIYLDIFTRRPALRKLFSRVKGRLTMELMTPREMPKEPLAKIKHFSSPDAPLPPNAQEAFLTRPTALFDSAYQVFLKGAGAIP